MLICDVTSSSASVSGAVVLVPCFSTRGSVPDTWLGDSVQVAVFPTRLRWSSCARNPRVPHALSGNNPHPVWSLPLLSTNHRPATKHKFRFLPFFLRFFLSFFLSISMKSNDQMFELGFWCHLALILSWTTVSILGPFPYSGTTAPIMVQLPFFGTTALILIPLHQFWDHCANSGTTVPILGPLHQFWDHCTNSETIVPILIPLHQFWDHCTNSGTTAPILGPLHQFCYQCTNSGTTAPILGPLHQLLDHTPVL